MRMCVSLPGKQHPRQRDLQRQGLEWERAWLVHRRERIRVGQEVTGDESRAGGGTGICSAWSAFIRAFDNNTILKVCDEGEKGSHVFNRHDAFY